MKTTLAVTSIRPAVPSGEISGSTDFAGVEHFS